MLVLYILAVPSTSSTVNSICGGVPAPVFRYPTANVCPGPSSWTRWTVPAFIQPYTIQKQLEPIALQNCCTNYSIVHIRFSLTYTWDTFFIAWNIIGKSQRLAETALHVCRKSNLCTRLTAQCWVASSYLKTDPGRPISCPHNIYCMYSEELFSERERERDRMTISYSIQDSVLNN